MNTKLIVFSAFILLVLTSLVLAESGPGILGIDPDTSPDDIIDSWSNKTQNSWDYLAKEWKPMILKNPIGRNLDRFFTRISIVFQILFGEPYTMSFVLFMVIIFWIFIAAIVGNAFETAGIIKNGTASFVFGCLASTIIAQMGLTRKLVIWLGALAFSPDKWWMRLIIVAIIVCSMVMIYYLDKLGVKWVQAMKKAAKERRRDMTEKKVDKLIEKAK